MASSTIMHGRREGQTKNFQTNFPHLELMAQGINPKEVAVFQPKDWDRIQKSLAKYNEAAEKAEVQRRDRENLHKHSKELVKHWENTIEGQRLKKLQARKNREEEEEAERTRIDIEEAKLQAEKRKQAIERAKKLQYYETDRVKGFHGALLLTEVLKERDAQIGINMAKSSLKKHQHEQFFIAQQQKYEDDLKNENQKAEEKLKKKMEIANFQKAQIKVKVNKSEIEKDADIEEGKTIKKQFDTFNASKKVIAEQQRLKKVQLMQTYTKEIATKHEKEKLEKIKGEAEDEKIRKFVKAKRKMASMRKEKERELFEAFKEHTEVMRDQLHLEMQRNVDDEDDRIAKTVAEREQKRIEEVERKQKQKAKALEAFTSHRKQMMDEADRTQKENKSNDRVFLLERIKEDRDFQENTEKKRQRNRNEARKLQNRHKSQMFEKEEVKNELENEQLDIDLRNTELLVKEEKIFQEYAEKVITDAKNGGRNPFPLIKAAQEGPGGGRGPKFEGNAGLRPSYIASDATGVQLPHLLKDENICNRVYGHMGKSGNRLGFTW